MLILDNGLLQPQSTDGRKEALYGCGCLVRLFLTAVAVLQLANDWAALRALHLNLRSMASGSRRERLKNRAGPHCLPQMALGLSPTPPVQVQVQM
jgi:hypothetical protein